MPFRSEAQRKLIYAKAAEGEAWAIKFIRDSGHTPPKVRRKTRKVRRA
jgi:hypothetical protein